MKKINLTPILNLENNFDSLIMIGDLHEEWTVISSFIKKFEIRNTCFFQVGDFGIGFYGDGFIKRKEDRKLNILNDSLIKSNNIVYVIRGNHDNPFVFDLDNHNNYSLSNINFLPDYSILDIFIQKQKTRILGIGGAISIDRKERTLNWNYWENEKSHFINDPQLLNQISDIDVIVTHTSPDFTVPYNFNNIVYHYAKNDSTLLDELRKERREMTYLIDYIMKLNPQLKHYFYGHFHYEETNEYKGVTFHLLNINQFKEVKI